MRSTPPRDAKEVGTRQIVVCRRVMPLGSANHAAAARHLSQPSVTQLELR